MKDGVKTRFNYHATEAYAKYLEIDRTTGYPKIAAGLRTAKETKAVYEVIFRKYLGIQYGESNQFKGYGSPLGAAPNSITGLAAGRAQPVPYGTIVKNAKRFIDKRYMPKH